MENLKEIIKELKSYTALGLKASDDIILDCATRIFISNNISSQKGAFAVDRPQYQERPKYHSNKDGKPTPKQRFFINETIGLTKEEIDDMTYDDAFILIKEFKEKNGWNYF